MTHVSHEVKQSKRPRGGCMYVVDVHCHVITRESLVTKQSRSNVFHLHAFSYRHRFPKLSYTNTSWILVEILLQSNSNQTIHFIRHYPFELS